MAPRKKITTTVCAAEPVDALEALQHVVDFTVEKERRFELLVDEGIDAHRPDLAHQFRGGAEGHTADCMHHPASISAWTGGTGSSGEQQACPKRRGEHGGA